MLMTVSIRRAQAADATECGRIMHAAFAAIATQHNFPPDFPSVEAATGVASMLIGHPGFYGVVAASDGRILGSNFLDERSPIGGIGPITVEPSLQNKGIGRQLMQAVIECGGKEHARHQTGAGCLSQSFIVPLRKFGFCD